jgi:DNA-binding winged helix-turn-helix (wHTH) protein/predicted ATPase
VANDKRIVFDPFWLDLPNECLWNGPEAIKLRPKAFAVLHYLLGHPGKLVTKDELLNAVWPGTFVAEGVLKVTIRQLRDVLGDDPKSPRFIETAHRRGYRFIGRIAETVPVQTTDQEARRIHVALGSPKIAAVNQRVVGRDRALSHIETCWRRCLQGERQIAFVTGEAGIGKTALVDAFARSIAADGNIRIARGQCLEQYGTGEAYLPVLDAIGRLCREQKQVVDVLRDHAPMWLLQMPSLVDASERESLSRGLSGATRERMLREMGEALETLTSELPLMLILEDLHWSDYSTLDLISYVARQRHPARLMLIGTYRPVELILSGHPLKAVKSELMAKQQCEELPLEYLSEDAIARYLSIRFPMNRFPARLAALIHERTEGSPLFMVNAVDYFVAQGFIKERDDCWELVAGIEKVQVGVPDSIKQMIEKQIDHLSADEQRILEIASVAGAEFSILAVASGLDQDRTLLEAGCDELARHRQFIQDHGVQELSNGQTVGRYGFIHALYQNVLYDRLSPSRRAQVHQRIGDWSEALYGEDAGEIAAELAMHFDRAGNLTQAIKYLHQAAKNDIRRFAYREAVALSRRGLELVKRLPNTPERARQELGLHVTLGVPLTATQGYAASDVGSTYARARELCRELGDTPEIAQVLWGVWTFYLVRAELGTAREIAEECLRVAEHVPYSSLAMEVTLIHLGEFHPALEHFKNALSLYDPERHSDDMLRYAQDSSVSMQSHGAWALWFVGQPDEAVNRMQSALALAHDLSEPHGLAHAFLFAAILYQLRRENRMAQGYAEAAVAIATEHQLLLYQAMASVVRGWAKMEPDQEEEIDKIRRGLEAYQATGTQLVRPQLLALLAEALHIAGLVKEALYVVAEALSVAQRNSEHYYDAELYRLKGALLLVEASEPALAQAAAGGSFEAERSRRLLIQAEECFDESIKIAQRQKARSLELRASTHLARHYQNQGRVEDARVLLSKIYSTFTEGFDTSDLRDAKALLSEIS